jgi:hypothetical protein
MTDRDAAIKQAVARVRASLDELEATLGAPVPAKRARAPRKRPTPAPTVTPSSEAVGVMRRKLRGMGVQA